MLRKAKICGLSTEETVDAAIDAGANYIGFVFFPPSPRNVDVKTASVLAKKVAGNVSKVGVFVDPADQLIADVIQHAGIDIMQLHGNETVERVNYIKSEFPIKVMKAISVASTRDIELASLYENHCDMLLFDAKAPKEMDKALPGGNGLAFDWHLIAGRKWNIPWMLSGGLNTDNVSEAIRISGAETVDVSSGLETSPGDKDINKIYAFMKAVQEAR